MPQIGKKLTRLVFIFGMTATLQFCCCILPIRWRVESSEVVRSTQPVQQILDRFEEGFRSFAFSLD